MVKQMSIYYVYHCDNCQVKFAVDQDFEDHAVVDCPLCHDDQYLTDAGEAMDETEIWVPVSNKLPEEYTLVLVWDGNGTFRAEYVNGNWHGVPDNTGFITESITHWQPLPKPPGLEADV